MPLAAAAANMNQLLVSGRVLILLVAITALPVDVQGSSSSWIFFHASSLLQPIPGEDFALGCNNNDPNISSFHWFINDTNITDNTNDPVVSTQPQFRNKKLIQSNLAIKPFSDEYRGNYTCRVIFSNSSRPPVDIYLDVTGQSYSLAINGNTDIIEGSSSQLSCDFASTDRSVDSYKWAGRNSSSEELVPLGDTTKMINISSTSQLFDQYTCTVTISPIGTQFSASTSVIFYSIPSVLGATVQSLEVMTGSHATLTCSISGNSVTYNWRLMGQSLSNVTGRYMIRGNNLTLLNIGYSTSGIYTCTAQNIAGNNSLQYNVTAIGAPVINAIAINVNQTLLEATPVTLNCAVTSLPVATIHWYRGDNRIVSDGRVTVNGASLSFSSLSFSDNGVYTCNASNEHGSDLLNYSLTIYGTPPTPDIVTVVNVSARSVWLSWQHEAQPLQAAERFVLHLTSVGGSFSQYTVSGDVTMATINNLLPDTEYAVRIVAVNRVGESQPSIERQFRTDKSAPKLSNISVSLLEGGRSLIISWDLLYTGGSPITLFNLSLITPEGTIINVPGVQLADGNITINGLEPNTNYLVQFNIQNSIGTANQTVTTTTARGPPGKPTTPVADNVRMTSVQLTFRLTSLGSEPLTSYLVNVSSDGMGVSQVRLPVTRQPEVGEDVSLTVSSLVKGRQYSFSVAGESSLGAGEYSDYSETITTDNGLLLYAIIGSTVGSALLILIGIVVLAMILCIVKRRRHTKHTITRRIYNNHHICPASSTCDKDSQPIGSEADTPPNSALGIHNECYTPHHRRTHSNSSTNSSHVMMHHPRRDMIPMIAPSSLPDAADSAYGGSAEKMNHLYAEIGGGNYRSLMFSSAPMINNIAYDVDSLPVKVNYATDV